MKLLNILWLIALLLVFNNYSIRIQDPLYFWGHFQWIQSQKLYLWQIIIPLIVGIRIYISPKLKLNSTDYLLGLLIISLKISLLHKLSLISLLIGLHSFPLKSTLSSLKIALILLLLHGYTQFFLQTDLNLWFLGEIDLSQESHKYNFLNIQRPYGPFDHPNLYAYSLIIISLFIKPSKIHHLALLLSLSLQNLIANCILHAKKFKLSLLVLIIALCIKNPWTSPASITDRLPSPSNITYKLKPWEHIPAHNIFIYTYKNHQTLSLILLILYISLILFKNKQLGLMLLCLSLLDHQIISQNLGLLSLCFINLKTKKGPAVANRT